MHEEIVSKYKKLIAEASALSHPRILINVCSHGNETIGLEVADHISTLPVVNGSVTVHVANTLAVEKGARFIETDLNRSFPGSTAGSYEEQIAHHMMEYISYFDYLIDIHSTVSGMENCLIVEDDSDQIQSMISVCSNAQTVLHMSATKGASIFTATLLPDKVIPAIAFEYGDNSEDTVKRTTVDIVHILTRLGVFSGIAPVSEFKPEQFECYEVYPKSETDTVRDDIINYSLVHKGQPIGVTQEGKDILSDSDFYPVLFGEKNYKTIFGFKARKV